MRRDTGNPSTGSVIATLPDKGIKKTQIAIDAAYDAQKEWWPKPAKNPLLFCANGMIL